MKKSRILLSAVAAAVFATSAGTLVACGDGVDIPVGGTGGDGGGTTHVVTFIPGDGATLKGITGTTMTTNKDGKLTGTMPTAEKTVNTENYTFDGWALTNGGAAALTTLNFNSWVFNADTPVYAVFSAKTPGKEEDEDGDGEFTIEFNYGNGTGSLESAKTVNKKLASLPTPTPPTDYVFDAWYTSPYGYGDLVTTSYEFSASGTIYANYTYQEPELEPTDYDLYVDDELAYNMVDSTPMGEDAPVWQKAVTGVHLTEGQTIQFYVEGVAVQAWMEGATKDCDCAGDTHTCTVALTGFRTNPRPSSFTATAEGDFDFYLKNYGEYNEAAQEGGYVVWVEGPAGEAQKVESDIKLTVGTKEYALTLNTAGGSETQKEYWLGGSKITLAKGDKITIFMGEDPISAFVEPSSSGVDKSVTDTAISEFTATFSGEFAVYLKENLNADGTHKDWSVQFAGSPSVDETDTLPAGAAKVELTFKDGKVTVYLVDTAGNGVGTSALSGYSVYTYGDEAFGAWDAAKTAGKLSNPSSASGYNVPNGWIFVWSGAQTSDIIGVFEAGKTYVVYLKDSNVGDCDVKLYTGTDVGGEDPDEPDEPDEPDNPDDPEVEAKLKHGNTEVGLTPSTPDASDKDIVWQMATQSVTLTKGTTIQFYVDGEVVEVWVEEDITAAVSGKNSRVDTITINADGNYDFYLKYYGPLVGSNGGYVLWVEGPEAEEGEDPTPTPTGGYVTGTFNEWGKGPALKGPTTNAYNQTEYSATFTTTKAGDTIKVILNGIWYAHLQSDVPASIAKDGGFTNDAPNITITSAGTYDLYLKIYREGDNNDGSHDIWIQKSSSSGGEGGEQGGGDEDDDKTTKADGLYVGGTLKVALTKNTGVTDTNIIAQYWIGGSKVNLTKGNKVSFYIDNTLVSAYIAGGSAGVEIPSTGTKYTEFTVTVTGDFDIYLTKYKDTGNWVIEFGGPTELGDAIEIPATASYVDILFKENKTVRVYIKEGNSFVDPKNFYFHTWGSGGDTSWPGVKIAGTTLDMSGVTISSSTYFIFNKGNGQPQTQNMTGLTAGGTFVLTFNGNNSTLAPGVVK